MISTPTMTLISNTSSKYLALETRGQDVLYIGIVHMIGYADGRVAQDLSPANQLAGYELAVAEGGVSVQIDHISPAETLLCIKIIYSEYPAAISVED